MAHTDLLPQTLPSFVWNGEKYLVDVKNDTITKASDPEKEFDIIEVYYNLPEHAKRIIMDLEMGL